MSAPTSETVPLSSSGCWSITWKTRSAPASAARMLFSCPVIICTGIPSWREYCRKAASEPMSKFDTTTRIPPNIAVSANEMLFRFPMIGITTAAVKFARVAASL